MLLDYAKTMPYIRYQQIEVYVTDIVFGIFKSNSHKY